MADTGSSRNPQPALQVGLPGSRHNEARYEAGRTGATTRQVNDSVELAIPDDPSQRQPKGDHNRRLALFLEPEVLAAEAGITEEALRDYERTPPDGKFDVDVGRRVGEALERFEAATPTTEKVIS